MDEQIDKLTDEERIKRMFERDDAFEEALASGEIKHGGSTVLDKNGNEIDYPHPLITEIQLPGDPSHDNDSSLCK